MHTIFFLQWSPPLLVIERDLSIKANVCSNSTELSNKYFEIQVLRSLRLSDSN